jgi:hypothetical protein
LQQFFDEGIKLSELTRALCNDYMDFLLKAKSQRSKKKGLYRNSAQSYFNKFKVALKQAYKDDLLKTDLNAKIQTIKVSETQREYLRGTTGPEQDRLPFTYAEEGRDILSSNWFKIL